MTTISLTFDLPSKLAHELESVNRETLSRILQRGLQEWRIERVLDRYRQGGMSFGAAAEQAGVRQDELARHAYARGLEPPSSEASLLEDLF